MRQRWATWCVVGLALVLGCDDAEDAEVMAAGSSETPAGETSSEEGPEAVDEPAGLAGPSGNVEGEPFVARGVLAQRIAAPKIEVRLFSRPVSCESFDDDYELSEDEKVVVVILEWPKDGGETIALGASNTSDFFQFCHGRESGRASCTPRAQEQGSLTLVEASEEGGKLSFDVASDEGELSGELEFTLCK